MYLSQLLKLSDFPAVVTGAHIRDLRAQSGQHSRDFVAGYLGYDARSHHALRLLLESLSQSQHGDAFWLNGVYGSGKSHLLGLLALLCDGTGHDELSANFPEFAPLLTRFQPRLTVSIALDDYSAARSSLETIFWRELDQQTARQQLDFLHIERNGSRAESFAALDEAMRAQGLDGLVVLFDELSLFLGGREARALQGDAAFLQFLGQHAARSALWVVASLQKTLDDIGELEPYALGQIRDRYTTLPLSLAHLPLLIERRLVQISDATTRDSLCDATFATVAAHFERLDFGGQEWRALFPFHPATVALLEAATTRFFSRTRSAVLFCRQAIEGLLADHAPAKARVYPDALWDYFAPELARHPDLRPLLDVWTTWDEAAPALFGGEAATARRAMKFLLVCKIAGQTPTSVALANALLYDTGLEGDGNYAYARQLLEKLRRGAPYLAVEQSGHADELHDRYAVDLGQRIADSARRHIALAGEGLTPGDARLAQAALRSCQHEPFPFAQHTNGQVVVGFWNQTPRRVGVVVWNGESLSALANRILETRAFEARLGGAGEDAILTFLLPFTRDQLDRDSLLALLPETRAKASLWVWKPRQPARDEWELCREVAAASLVALDPALLDNRRGRAVLEHLERGAPARESQLARVVARLYLEGEIWLGSGAVLEASELARGDSFTALVEAVGDFALPHLYPRFEAIAPRARIMTPSNADSVCLEILRRSSDEPFFAPSLERLARHLGEPLGVAKASSGRWKIASGQEKLLTALKAAIGEGATFSEIEARLGESEWGLPRELFAVAVCAALRSGEVVAFDERGQELAPFKIGLPLRRSLYFLRPGVLPTQAQWTKLSVLGRELFGLRPAAPSFEATQKLFQVVQNWRDGTTGAMELARSRAVQLRRQLGHLATDWPRFEADCARLIDVLETVPPGSSSSQLLENMAAWPVADLQSASVRFGRTADLLEQRLTPLLRAHNLLTAADLVVPAELAEARATLLEQFCSGESVLQNDALLDEAARWSESYTQLYAAWHSTQHDPARWNSWRRLAGAESLRAAEKLATLEHPAFGLAVREEIETELQKRCGRDGQPGPGSSTCPSCGLRFNERLNITNPVPVQQQIEAEIEKLRRLLAQPTIRGSLERRQSGLLGWDDQSDALLPFLTTASLNDLYLALQPRRLVARSLAELSDQLKTKATRAEVTSAFFAWLDGDEPPGEDDEIALSE